MRFDIQMFMVLSKHRAATCCSVFVFLAEIVDKCRRERYNK